MNIKYVFLISIFFISCSNQMKNMSNQTIDIKLIQSWQQEKRPSDVVADQSNQKWLVLGARDKYWEHSAEGETKEKATSVELYRAERSSEGFYVLTYNTTTRENEAWIVASLDLENKTKLELNDPADIAYSVATKQLYSTTHSKRIMVYNDATKTSSPVLENQVAAECLASANGRFLALRDTDGNFAVVDLETNTIVLEQKAEAGKYYDLVGATNSGQLILCSQFVERKNQGKSRSKNQILSIAKGAAAEVVLEAEIAWARMSGKNLITWGGDTLSVYEVTNF